MNSHKKGLAPRWLTAVFMFIISSVLIVLTYIVDIVGAFYYYLVILIALLLWVFVDNQLPENLGFKLKSWWWLQLILGILIGATVIGLFIWLEAILGWIILTPIFLTIPLEEVIGWLITYAIWQGLVATTEELVFRGYIQQNLATSLFNPIAIFTTALMFAITHIPSMIWNAVPLINAGIWFLNLTLGGILLGIAFTRTKKLWLPIGIHFGWNFMQYHIAGFRDEGIISVHNLAPDILTGGAVGPEAGFIGTLAFITLIAVIWAFTQTYDGNLLEGFQRKPLILFLFGFLIVAVPACWGLIISGLGLFLIIWLVFLVVFLQVWENRILCSHCPYYGKEGRVLRCHGNYGLYKLWKYNPGPMNRSERIQFIIGVVVIFGYPFPFLIWSQQWLLLAFTSLGAIGLATILFGWLCLRCVNFSCPFNRVPKNAVDEFLRQNPEMKKAWQATGYKVEPERKTD
ncbi:MAG: lysostaphin resistance A-like protein [Candidatus Hodarchaeota archaeon]